MILRQFTPVVSAMHIDLRSEQKKDTMRNIFRILVIGIIGMTVFSCQTDEIVPVLPDNGSSEVGVYGDQIKLRLNVVAPDPIRVNTRAVDPDGKGIQTMTLFCFDQYGLFISTATASLTPDPTNDETGGIFDAFIPNTTRAIHLVGNQNMTPFREDDFRQKTEDEVLSILEGSAGMLIYWARVEVPSEVQNLYTEVKDLEGNSIQGRSVADAILDWITIETNPVNQAHRGVAGQNYPIVMLRNQARVTVASAGDTNEGKQWNGEYFKVTGFTVMNTKAFGTVAPYSRDHRFPTYKCTTFTPGYSVEDWADDQYITLPENREKLSDIMDVDTAEETYVFETENSSADPVDVIIKGKNVVGGVEQEELYYKVNIVDKDGEQVPIRRNHHYQINIVGNLDYGSPNFGESLDAPATNNIWLSISDEVKTVMNTDYVLTVDQTKVVINDADIPENPNLTLTFSVVRNQSDGDIDSANLSVSWVEDNQTVSSTHNPNLVIGDKVAFEASTGKGSVSLQLNRLQTDAEFDYGTLLVKYGHLQRKIRVVIVRTQKFIPSWVSTEVYGAVTGDKESRQNITVIFSIPEDCPSELFPMDVLITANNLDVRSQSGQILPIVRRGEAGYGKTFSDTANDGTVVTDVGYKYVFTVTEPGMKRLYLENILNSASGSKEYITLEAENFEILTKTATFVEHENKIVLPKLKSYLYSAAPGAEESDVIHYMLVPQKRYAPVVFDLSLQVSDGTGYGTISNEEFILNSSNLDHYEDNDNRLSEEYRAGFDCDFVPYEESLWSTGGRVYGFYPRQEKAGNGTFFNKETIDGVEYNLFQIYMETNKANSSEIVRIASNQKGSPSIKNAQNSYSGLTFRSVTFEMSTYRPFRFAAQVNDMGKYVDDSDLAQDDKPVAETVSNVLLPYSAESYVDISFDVTSFLAADGTSVDPFGTGFEIYIDAPMLKLVTGDNPSIEGEEVAMFEKNANGSLPETIPKLQDLGDGRFVYRVDQDRTVEAGFWNGASPLILDDAAVSQTGERKTIRFRTNSIVSSGDITISSDQEQVVYHSKTFKLSNTPMTGEILYKDSEGATPKPLPANQFVSFSRLYDGSRIGSMLIGADGNYTLRLRREYEFYWRNDPIELVAHVDDGNPATDDYYYAQIQDLETLSESSQIVLVRAGDNLINR